MSQQFKVCITPRDDTKNVGAGSGEDVKYNRNSLHYGCTVHPHYCWCSQELEEVIVEWGGLSHDDYVYDYEEVFGFKVESIYLRQCLLDVDFLYYSMTRMPTNEESLLHLRRVYTGKIVTESGYLMPDEVVICNPKAKRGADAPAGVDCNVYAGIQRKKHERKMTFKRGIIEQRKEKRKQISTRRNCERCFSYDDPVFEDLEEKKQIDDKATHRQIRAMEKQLHRLVLDANKRNKEMKKKRKIANRVVTEADIKMRYPAWLKYLDSEREIKNPHYSASFYGAYTERDRAPDPLDVKDDDCSSYIGAYDDAKEGQRYTRSSDSYRLSCLSFQLDNYDDVSEYGTHTSFSSYEQAPFWTPNEDERLLMAHLDATRKMRKQSSMIAKAWHEKVKVPDFMNMNLTVVFEQFKNVLGPIIDIIGDKSHIVGIFLDVITYVYLVRKCDAEIDFVLLTRWFICSTMREKSGVDQTAMIAVICGIGGFAKTLVGIISTVYARGDAKSKIVTEGFFSDSIDSFASFIKNIHDSNIIAAIRNIAVSIAALKMFDLQTAKNIFKYCGKPIEGGPVDLVTTILSAIASIVRSCELVYEGVPLSDALFGNDPLKEAIAVGKRLITYKDRLYYGLPVPGRMEEGKFVSTAGNILPILQNAMKKVGPFSPTFKQCNDIVSVLHPAWEGVRARILGSERMAPFGVIVSSEPGVGKSSILPWIGRILSNVMDREYEESQVFHRIKSSDFWEGYDSFLHKIVHYSELGDSTPSYARMHGDDIITELTSVIDNVSLPLNMAFDGKGKSFFNSELVLIDTNNTDMNLKEFVNNPAAFKRRFLYVIPSVKEEYRVDGGCGLDPLKCLDNKRMMDRFTFTIYRQKQMNRRDSEKVVLGINKDCDEAYDIIYEQMRKHFENQHRVVRGTRADVHVKYGNAARSQEKAKPDDVPNPYVWSDDDEENKSYSDDFQYVRGRIKSEADDDIDPIPGGWWQLISGLFVAKPYVRGFDLNYMRFLCCFAYYVFDCFKDSVGCTVALNTYSIIPDSWVSRVHRLFKLGLTLMTGIISISVAAHNLFWGIVMFVMLQTAFENMIHHPLANEVERRRVLRERRDESVRRLQVALGVESQNVMFYSAMALGTFAVSAYLIKHLLKMFSSVSAETETVFHLPSEHNAKLNEVEVKIGTERAVRRKAGLIPDAWVTQAVKTPVVHTNGPKSLDTSIAQNCRSVVVEWGGKPSRTCALGICEDYILLNRHCLPVSGDFTIKVNMTGVRNDLENYRETKLSIGDEVKVTDDIVMVRVSQMQFKDITKHFCDVAFKYADGYICGYPVKLRRCVGAEAHNEIHGKILVRDAISYHWPNHRKGACGSPVIVGMANRAYIGGMHFAGDELSNVSFAVTITKQNVDEALEEARQKRKLMRVVSQSEAVVSLGDPKQRSPFNYENFHCLEYWGSDDSVVSMNNKSSLKKTRYGGRIAKSLSDIGFVKSVDFVPPILRPIKKGSGEWVNPYTKNLTKLNTRKKSIDGNILARCVLRFVDHIVENVKEELHPIPLEEAINGARDDEYLRRINVRTGAGYGFSGKKHNFLPIVKEEAGYLLREPTGELKKKLADKIDQYLSGESVGAIFGAKLKDEPRQIEKVLAGKTRMFFPSQLDLLIVSRMVLAPFFTLMVAHRRVFMSSVGIDMHTEGHEFRRFFAEFSGNIFEGDYGGFDTSMPFEIGLGASTVLHDTCKAMGYNDESLALLRGVLSDNLFPIVEVNGDVMCVPGLMTSGSYGTAEFNCIRNVLLMMYYFEAHPNLTLDDFFTKLRVTTYGDDVVGAVLPDIADKFNCVVYSRFCKEVYGMDFTTSDKGEVKTEFTTVEHMSFLKRQFKFNNDIGVFTSVLDQNSLFKMVEWFAPSAEVTEIDQAVSTCTSLLYEVALWLNKETFNSFRLEIRDILRECYDCPYINLPTWDKIVSCINPDAITLRGEEECKQEVGPDGDHELGDDPCLKISGNLVTEDLLSGPRFQDMKIERQFDDMKIKMRIEVLEKRKQELLEEHKDLLTNYDQVHPLDLVRSMGPSGAINEPTVGEYRRVWAEIDEIESTVAMLKRILNKRFRSMFIRTESSVGEMESGTVDKSAMSEIENVIDIGGDASDSTVVGRISQYLPQDDFDVKKFLSRPVQIAAQELVLGATLDFRYNIWDLFTSDPTVRSKLRNFAFMRCNLKVRIAVSGTPFHYGKLLVSYQPFPDVNWALTNFGTSHRNARLKYLSQAPGARVIDVRSNAPLEITCPYVAPKPVGRLFNSTSETAISSATPLYDFSELGSLYVYTLNTVHACSTNPTPAYMYIYLYAEDVHLHGSSGTQMSIVTESDMKDEREVGPVERVASAMVDVSIAAKKVPWLAPYASISQMAFGALRGLSALFGWSYPTIISVPHRVRPDPFQNGAQLIGYDTGKRITLDPKQELAINPGFSGMSEDEMALSSICKRESLFDTFDWDPETVPMTSILWQAVVSPRAQKVELYLGNYYANPTPLSFAATPFEYWRGKITYRLEIVTSNFHRGKLMIVYEPNVAQYGLIAPQSHLNKQYVRVIDIQETQDIEFCVDWNFSRPWARNLSDVSMCNSVGDQFNYPLEFGESANGIIYVVPFTQLQSPDDNPIQVNVYVRSDEMHFNRLTDEHLPESKGYIVTESEITSMESSCIEMNKAVLPDDHISQDCFGEEPLSFRALLRRYTSQFFSSTEAETYFQQFTLPVFPPYNTNNLYSYLKWSFLCQRGAFKHRTRVAINNAVTTMFDSRIIVSLKNDSATNVTAVTSAVTVPPKIIIDGSVQFMSTVNTGIEYEIPFYTNNLFAWACNDDPFLETHNMSPLALRDYTISIENGATSRVMLFDAFATGEDFNLSRWLGAYPYKLNIPPS